MTAEPAVLGDATAGTDGTGLAVDVAVRAAAWTKALAEAETACRRAAAAAIAADGADVGGGASRHGVEVSIVLADDAFQRDLNRRYRDRDAATNVLSFPAGDAAGIGAPRMLGDIVVAFETASAEARDEGKTLADHLSHLVVHGMLHLLGHDHEIETDAEAMERLEARILSSIGIADPYGAVRQDAQPGGENEMEP